SAGLTQDDLVVVQALYQAGASAMVLISKADLFSATERGQMISYVKTNLHDQLRIEPPVHAVSVFGTESVLCDRWFETELRPFLTRYHELAIIDVAAERIATALIESGNADVSLIFSDTLKSLVAEPVAATLRLIEQTRSELVKAVETAASASEWTIPDELPKPAGMPMLDVNEISQKMAIEKPRVLSLFVKSAVASQVRRKLECEYDRTLLEFLSLYANRLRRWMEQSINALRNAFNEFSDMHRAHFEAAPA